MRIELHTGDHLAAGAIGIRGAPDPRRLQHVLSSHGVRREIKVTKYNVPAMMMASILGTSFSLLLKRFEVSPNVLPHVCNLWLGKLQQYWQDIQQLLLL